eukprot:GILK01003724.1.p1 GENE.GILK01003724.1~~GILK01003724.1.p1  ORF type:complete len:346 (+),score=38.25 GILK01003724.1:118-1155(+)
MLQGVIGVLVLLVGCLFDALGVIVQKMVHKQIAETNSDKPFYKYKLWYLGLFLLVCGSVLGIVSYSLADQATLAPTSAFTMIYNAILASKLLKEKFTKYDLAAIIFLGVGATVSVVWADYTEISYAYYDIMSLWGTVHSLLFVLLTLAVFVGLYMWANVILSKPIPEDKPWMRELPMFFFACFAGFMVGVTGLLVKSTMEMIKSQFNGANNIQHPLFWFFILFSGMSVASQVYLLNCGLKYYDALEIVPVYESSLVISGELCGGIVLNEFKHFSRLQLSLFFLGTSLVIAGMVTLSRKTSTTASLCRLSERLIEEQKPLAPDSSSTTGSPDFGSYTKSSHGIQLP